MTHESDNADYNEESSGCDACIHHNAVVSARRPWRIISNLKFIVRVFLSIIWKLRLVFKFILRCPFSVKAQWKPDFGKFD